MEHLCKRKYDISIDKETLWQKEKLWAISPFSQCFKKSSAAAASVSGKGLYRWLDKRGSKHVCYPQYFSYYSTKSYVVHSQKNREDSFEYLQHRVWMSNKDFRTWIMRVI